MHTHKSHNKVAHKIHCLNIQIGWAFHYKITVTRDRRLQTVTQVYNLIHGLVKL